MKQLSITSSQTNTDHNRRGASLVEFGAILGVWSVLFLATFDFGIGTFRLNLVSHVARQAVRMAIVRGAEAGPELPVWGPDPITFKLSDQTDIAETVRTASSGLMVSGFEVTLEWPDGNNMAGSTVRATVSSTHESVLGGFSGSFSVPVRSVSTLRIAH
ncbi:MAG: TadE/TadG family type IV pilus assembly protein [Planctomycetaceae bacterium]